MKNRDIGVTISRHSNDSKKNWAIDEFIKIYGLQWLAGKFSHTY
jgi:hypothetical protein